jgi:thioester reductase-like protein
LPQNFVFEHPALLSMANELTRLRLGQAATEMPSLEQRMEALIDEYGTFTSQGPFRSPAVLQGERDDSQCLLITGTTGSLGAHIAAKLSTSSRCSAIYCLVRAPSPIAAKIRLRKSLQARGLYHTLSSTARRKLIPLPADLTEPRLGLDEKAYDSLTSTITSVIHCAWSVNFNLALESFRDCISGTRHLLDLCLASQRPGGASFTFSSSVSTVAKTPGDVVPEALPACLTYAQDMGYAQAKLVAEHIVRRAAEQTGMTARVLRVGQIIADTKLGIWNSSEAIPMIFQTAETIHLLPQLDEMISWTPVDIIASSVIELAQAPNSDIAVVNVTNPTLMHWTKD